MQRIGRLWPRLVAFDNLWQAWRRARAGKRARPDVAAFELDLEGQLLGLQRELVNGRYRPGAYRLFTVYERKPRLIAAAPFRDRVVHHALMAVIEAPLDQRFIGDCYACRQGKGAHAAVARYQGWARRYRYALKLDIRHYFASIDRDRLKAKLRARIKDRPVLALLDRIIDGSPGEGPNGIPIGNLTSQFFANLYLDDFDHWVKQDLRVKPYLRYVDDMVLLADDKLRLAEWRQRIRAYLAAEQLRLHPRKAHISPTRGGLNLLGYQVFPDRRRLANGNGYRFRRHLRWLAERYQQGLIDWEAVDPSVQAWIGHARHADTAGLRQAIFEGVSFQRGSGPEASAG